MYLPYPVLVAINESDKKLVQDYGCKLPNEDTLYVKRDYIYNGASIPRVFWWFGSPYTGRYTRAAFVHDVLYDSNLYSQSDADRVFLEIMDFSGCSWFRRNIMWSAVRMFGWTCYEKTEGYKKRMRKLISITKKK